MATRRSFLQHTVGTGVFAAAGTSLSPMARARDTAAAPSPPSCANLSRPMKDVAGKVAFITGGSGGIGLGMARAFLDAGMKVVITYLTEQSRDEALEELKDGRARLHAINVDVTDRASLQRAAEETVRVFGKVHVLVNNAGVYAAAPLSTANVKDWEWMMGVNLQGVFNGIQVFAPYIQAHGEGGQIVCTSSMWGLATVSGSAIYCASKAAVIALCEALRGELAESHIGVSVFCPGGVTSKNRAAPERDRPAHLRHKPETVLSDKEKAELQQQLKRLADTQVLMDAQEAGRIVLRGIRQNDLYILSHAEYAAEIRERGEALLASIPTDVPVSEARKAGAKKTHPVYADQIRRRRCPQLKV